MSYIREETGTIIITGGRVYATFKQEPVVENDVCQLCELQDDCKGEKGRLDYRKLCEANECFQGCFFKEVKPSTKLTIFDVAAQQDIHEACDAMSFEEREL